MNKTLVFDMDGTLADLYGVDGWLEMLMAEDATPYKIAKALYDMVTLDKLLKTLKEQGWKVVITSWLSKNGSDSYDKEVTRAKIDWLDAVEFPYDEIHIIKYGVNKTSCTRDLGGFQILFDDCEDVRNKWDLGAAVNANKDILKVLERLTKL